MRTSLLWKELSKDRAGGKSSSSVTAVAFSPDGSQLLASSGKCIYVYSAYDGTLIQTLGAHSSSITCLVYANDGKKFASGGMDKKVVIWTPSLIGRLKFEHGDGIRCMQFNPVTHQLATCTGRDYGFWSSDSPQVPKYPVDYAITSCSWTSDGCHLILAFSNGNISLFDRYGHETRKITRHEKQKTPILSLACSPKRDENPDVIVIVDQNQTLAFFDITGKQVLKDKFLGFDALTVGFTADGEHLMVSGSNKQAILYTKDGIFINSICELSTWILCCQANLIGSQAAVGTEDGELAVYELIFLTVHSIYREHYAYRNAMTDVIIQHLITDEKVRIKCRDLVKKIAIYRDRLAIQLGDKIVIYELVADEEKTSKNKAGMHYRVRDKINRKSDSALLIVASDSVILSCEKRLTCLNFQGIVQREWDLESFVRYVRPTGGPLGKEGILLGLRNGQILQIFINNPFAITVLQIESPVRCLDLSIKRRKLAVVDDQGNLNIYDMRSTKLLIPVNAEGSANSVTWNSEMEDMLSFSVGSGTMYVQVDNFVVYQQPLPGFVVGFVGAKVFCLQQNSVITIEISQTSSLKKYMKEGKFENAYRVACLSVTQNDWKDLAHTSLENMNLKIARHAFSHLGEFTYLDLIRSFELSIDKSKKAELSFLGDVMAFRGRYSEAAKLYKQAGQDEKSINMYTDLKMFDQAQDLIRSGDASFKKQLAMKKAAWIENINEPRAAAEMYLMAGEMRQAIDIIGNHAWIDMLMNVVRSLDKGDRENLTACAKYLVKHKQYFNAAEVYRKVGDIKSLATVYVLSYQWDEAFTLCQEYPDMDDVRQQVYGSYAEWLAEEDRFTEAQAAFHKAGLVKQALQVLQQLTANAIEENRFCDAGYYSWILSNQCLEMLSTTSASRTMSPQLIQTHLDKYYTLQRMADIYYAYEKIYRFIEEPFTSCFPDTLFNMARYLFHEMTRPKESLPEGVSKVMILYALSKQCRTLGAFKLARVVYEELQKLYIPKRFVTSIEMGDLASRAKPFSDAEDLLPLCYRCSTTNPLMNPKGMQCINCQQPFILSFASFDVLPVVEFVLEDGITHEEAMDLVRSAPKVLPSKPMSAGKKDRWQEERSDQYQTLKLTHEEDMIENDDELNIDQQLSRYYNEQGMEGAVGSMDQNEDPFTANLRLKKKEESEQITVGRETLRQLKKSDIFVAHRPQPLGYSYYRNLVPDMNVTMCSSCFRFFMEDFEASTMLHGCCPYCRKSDEDK